MGISLTVFTLFRLENRDRGCRHHLLLRVEQPEFSNADAASYDRTAQAAGAKRAELIHAYEADVLARECAAPHDVILAGELQSRPAGDLLADADGGRHVDLRIAGTRFGPPWVVMGTAEDEAAFWRQAEADGDLASLGPLLPATAVRAFFLSES